MQEPHSANAVSCLNKYLITSMQMTAAGEIIECARNVIMPEENLATDESPFND